SLPAGAQLTTHGCGLTHPLPETAGDPNPDQPANRRVEVFLFEGQVDPQPVNPCPASGCTQYDQWVAHKILDVDLDQPPGGLRVKVTDPSGTPVSGAAVHAAGPLPLDGTTGADGFVSFNEIVPGSYRVVADKDGFSAAETTVVVPSGSGTSGGAQPGAA